jgi:hypothetical protein|tara:strand:- start:20839 stop:21231 length:393 start_codon:yes stop_codon:yes gene_type:complete
MTMFISDSYQQQGGGGTSVSSNNYTLGNDFSIHALRRDADGMLRYTKIRSIDDETGDFFRLDGSSYLDIATGAYDYVEETTEEKSYSNNPQDKYQQYRFDSRKISYFVDDDGYFVIRFNENYDYSTEGPK